MDNVQITNGKDTITITIKADKATIKGAPASKSGKTRLLASTHGAMHVSVPGLDGGVKVALNVMLPA